MLRILNHIPASTLREFKDNRHSRVLTIIKDASRHNADAAFDYVIMVVYKVLLSDDDVNPCSYS